ncbi:hypothetical protein T492DRAFT_997786, partial [Pavlovales sp. CCMP2436]
MSSRSEEPWNSDIIAKTTMSKMDLESATGTKSAAVAAPAAPKAAAASSSGKQDFLEANPYWDVTNIPLNTYKNKTPFTGKGKTGSLCVRRATYTDPETGKDDDSKKGVCSNFLCDAKPGLAVTMTGPSGKVMLIPEQTPTADLIMVATGTGIAPYRAFIRRLFVEKTPAGEAYKGQAWLFLGVANTDSLLYDDEWQASLKVEEYAEEIFAKLDGGAHMYFCGLKGMMPGITDMLERVATSKGLKWSEKLEELKHKGQWHVEVY